MAAVPGIVLAAGWSRRMGRPKALLPCLPGGETFVARTVRILGGGGVDGVIVVGRSDDEGLQAELGRLSPEPAFVVNPDPDRGQLSSVLAGVDAAATRGAEAVMVLPVDLPQVRPETVAAILGAFAERHPSIVRATHRGRHGHPVLFARAVFGELRAADPRVGARSVLHAHPARVLDVEVPDPGVLRDVDRPADYAALFGEPPR